MSASTGCDYQHTSRGFSQEAKTITEIVQKAKDSILEGAWSGRSEAFGKLDEVYYNCCESNWNGEQGSSISESTYQKTKYFLETLPIGLPSPDITPQPDGEISLEWYENLADLFSISISYHKEITWSGIIEGSPIYGFAEFDTEIPSLIVKIISEFK